MPEERWEEIEALFNSIIDLPAGQRGTVLRCECPDDLDLVTRVGRLLAAHARNEQRIQGVVDRAFTRTSRTQGELRE